MTLHDQINFAAETSQFTNRTYQKPSASFLPTPEYMMSNSVEHWSPSHVKDVQFEFSNVLPPVYASQQQVGSWQPFQFQQQREKQVKKQRMAAKYEEFLGEVQPKPDLLLQQSGNYFDRLYHYEKQKSQQKRERKPNKIDDVVRQIDKRRIAAERVLRRYDPEGYMQKYEDNMEIVAEMPPIINQELFQQLAQRRAFFDDVPLHVKMAREEKRQAAENSLKQSKILSKFAAKVEIFNEDELEDPTEIEIYESRSLNGKIIIEPEQVKDEILEQTGKEAKAEVQEEKRENDEHSEVEVVNGYIEGIEAVEEHEMRTAHSDTKEVLNGSQQIEETAPKQIYVGGCFDDYQQGLEKPQMKSQEIVIETKNIPQVEPSPNAVSMRKIIDSKPRRRAIKQKH